FVFITETSASEIHNAIQKGDITQIKKLISADPNCINVKDNDGITPLSAAILAGKRPVIDLLISKGADIAVKDEEGITALHLAATAGDAATVRQLLAKGANPSVKSNTGFTPLHAAAVE